MRRAKKVWLSGFAGGAVAAFLVCGGFYYWENGRIPLVGDSLTTGYSGRKLSAIENIIEEHYLEDVDMDELADYMYAGLVAGLGDRYSVYYTTELYDQIMESNNGTYKGLGVVMEQDEETNVITVKQCYANSPAQQAGVLAGDIIYQVDDKIASEMTSSELAEYIRSKETIVLYIQREGTEELLEMEVTLAEVEIPSIYSRMLDDSMGYIQIEEFTDVTSEQFEIAYQELLEDGMEGLIVDLRENPGGLLNAVCDTLEQILPEGMIVYTEDKYGNRKEYTCEGETPIEIPMVLLTNENSASASEIFAAAVQDHEVATLVGTTTFGKGIVQKYFSFGDGSAVKVTISNYYTPNGKNIHGKGVEPDVEVKWKSEEKFLNPSVYYELPQEQWEQQDNQFEKAVEVLAELIDQE